MNRMFSMKKMASGLLFATVVLTAGFMLITGCASVGPKKLVEDREKRFFYELAGEDFVEIPTDGSYFSYHMASPAMDMYVVAEAAMSEDAGVDLAISKIGRDPSDLTLVGTTSAGNWSLMRYEREGSDIWTAIAYQYRGSSVYAVLLEGGPDSSPDSPPRAVMHILGTFTIAGAQGAESGPGSLAELEDYIADVVEPTGGSISIAAVKDGRVIYRYAVGNRDIESPTSPDTAYNWGSITKIVTATAVLQLVDEGLIDLDATLDTYFPEFGSGSEITVRNLLTHSAGLPNKEADHIIGYEGKAIPPLEFILAEYLPSAQDLVFTPGSSLVYSNWNFLFLGVLVERVSGQPLPLYAQEHIFIPLGLHNTAHAYQDLPENIPVARSALSSSTAAYLVEYMGEYGIDGEELFTAHSEQFVYVTPVNILPAWGGIWSTAEDAARFGWAFVNGGKVSGATILEKKTAKQMLKMQKSNSGEPLGIGLGWFLKESQGEKIAEHSGGGFGINALLHLYPKQNMAVAVLGSTEDFPADLIMGYTVAVLSQEKNYETH
jgi:CubicO group peptidase (beta-lactamase class C family)